MRARLPAVLAIGVILVPLLGPDIPGVSTSRGEDGPGAAQAPAAGVPGPDDDVADASDVVPGPDDDVDDGVPEPNDGIDDDASDVPGLDSVPDSILDSVPDTGPDSAPDGIPDSVPDSVRALGGSISCGATNRGALYGARSLARYGIGYWIPEPWWSRGHNHGTEELVGLIERSAATVAARLPGGILGVADLSRVQGGPIPGHRSHQAGRDADLIFYALDPQGQPFPPDAYMPYYAANGRARYAQAPVFARDIAERYFDLARNWALVKALITDPQVQVERIFVSHRIRRWLLDYARHIGEPEDIVRQATYTLMRPRNAEAHNDHMHVRVACSADDIAHGRCRNASAPRPGRSRRWHTRVRCPRPRVLATETLSSSL